MRLQSFVLAARLEQVAEVASRRLLDMSGGRYTFLHSDAQGRHGARGGLGLDVFDEYTGCAGRPRRSPAARASWRHWPSRSAWPTSSRPRAGGVQLDTLFVDEGFGTLDPQALDAVMTVLDELRRGGRTVGVISHVEELRTRIPSRLQIIASRQASRLASWPAEREQIAVRSATAGADGGCRPPTGAGRPRPVDEEADHRAHPDRDDVGHLQDERVLRSQG